MAENKKRRRTQSDFDSQPFKNHLKPDEEILQILESLKSSLASSSTAKSLTLADLSLSSTCGEESDLSSSCDQSAIESVFLQLTHQILSGQGFSFTVPSRSSTYQLYVPELDRFVSNDKSTVRPFSHISSVRKATITAKILSLVHQLFL